MGITGKAHTCHHTGRAHLKHNANTIAGRLYGNTGITIHQATLNQALQVFIHHGGRIATAGAGLNHIIQAAVRNHSFAGDVADIDTVHAHTVIRILLREHTGIATDGILHLLIRGRVYIRAGVCQASLRHPGIRGATFRCSVTYRSSALCRTTF